MSSLLLLIQSQQIKGQRRLLWDVFSQEVQEERLTSAPGTDPSASENTSESRLKPV